MSTDLMTVVKNGVAIVELESRYDVAGSPKFEAVKDFLAKQSESIDPPLLLLDLTNTEFFGSNFISLLFAVRRTLEGRGGLLALCNVNPDCLGILKVVRFHTLCEIYDTRDKAVDALVNESKTAD